MITCMIIDDEPLAVDLLKGYVEKIPFLELIYAGTKPVQALEELNKTPADLIFLDIQMPDITGLHFMKLAGKASRVIFTTAYAEFALDGYEHNAIDYLLKPVTFEKFYSSALKARTVIESPVNTQPVTHKAPAGIAGYIFVKTDNKIVKVFLTDILFFEGLRDYIAIHTRTEKLIVLDNLKAIEAALPAEHFVRVHKSFIVALEKIDTIERSRIYIGTDVIPVGESYREVFMSLLKHRQFG